MKRRHFPHFNLFFFSFGHREEKKESLHHLHNSWSTQEKNRPLSGKEKSWDGVIVARE